MRRKLVKQGKGALTISLPKEWILENTLSQGNDVIIEQQDNNLLLKPEEQVKQKEAKLTLEPQSPEAYRSILGSLYRGGYDIINIKFKDTKVIQNLEKAVNSIYGYELFYISDTECIIKTIYNNENTEIKLHHGRMVYAILTMQSIIQRDFKESKKNSKEELLQLRNNILKQRDLIVRVIKKKHLLQNNVFPYYTISLSLWGIARNYYHLYTEIESIDNLELLETINSYFRKSFKNIDNISMKRYLERHKEYEEVYKQCIETGNNNPLVPYCMSIILQIQLSDSSIYLLNYG